MIAVMGAAGNVGGKVADLLLNAGQDVRVFEHGRPLDALRERGAELVKGDAVEVEDLRSLFGGAEAALVLLPENLADPEFAATRSRMCRALGQALSERPVGHVLALSAVVVDREDVAGPPAGLRELEQRLFELAGTNVLVLRSGFYMDYLLANLPLVEEQGINGSVIRADLELPMIATQDVAREAADRLLGRDFTGHGVKMLLGPEDVSMREATRQLGSLLGRPELRYVEIAPAQLKVALLGAGMSDEAASLLVDMQVALNEGGWFDGIRGTGETTTATSLEEYLAFA
jgi:uncharacterized protein YbjT (DUF2867 family)